MHSRIQTFDNDMCRCSKEDIKSYNGSHIDIQLFRLLGFMISSDIHGR